MLTVLSVLSELCLDFFVFTVISELAGIILGRVLIMEKAAIYARVSTEDQAQHGVSLDAQVNRCVEYVSVQNYDLIDTIVDAGISGKSIDRPGLSKILSLVQKKKINHLVTLKLDRLSRRTIDALNLVETFTKKNVKLHLVTENGSVNSDNADDEFMLTMKAGFAQLERKKIAENSGTY